MSLDYAAILSRYRAGDSIFEISADHDISVSALLAAVGDAIARRVGANCENCGQPTLDYYLCSKCKVNA